MGADRRGALDGVIAPAAQRAAPHAGGAPVEPARYAALLEHAEIELELAGRGEVDALAALGERWDELVAGLPARAPDGAAALLERALLMHERTRIELIRLREAMLADFATSSSAQRAADGYAGTLAARSAPRSQRLD